MSTQANPRSSAHPSYLRLVAKSPLVFIRTRQQLDTAIDVGRRLESRHRLNAGEFAYLEALLALLSACEGSIYLECLSGSDADKLFNFMALTHSTPMRINRNTGLSVISICEVLDGRRRFDPKMIEKLAKFFNLPFRFFLADQ
jgi:hypothetical protein